MASIKDVARHAGVSIASVSRVLNSTFPVTERTRDRVLLAVNELDYRVDQRARALRRRRSGTLGLIVSDVGNPFFPQVLHAIEAGADENEFSLFLCNSDEDLRRQRLHVDSMIEQRIEGVIVMPIVDDRAVLAPLIAARIPIVLLDRSVTGGQADSVLLDNHAGSELAVQHLYALGHRRIAMISVAGTPPGDERLEGARRALAAQGLVLDPDLAYAGELKESGGYAQMQALLGTPQPPTAVIVVNNPMAIGALVALRERGLRVPQDMSVVAFDDVSWANLLQPPLTTIQQPTRDIGNRALQLLIERVERHYLGPPRRVLLPPSLVERESTCAVTSARPLPT